MSESEVQPSNDDGFNVPDALSTMLTAHEFSALEAFCAWVDAASPHVQAEVRRAVLAIQLGHELLARLVDCDGEGLQSVLKERAKSRDTSLTMRELDVVCGFLEGRSTKSLAQERGLKEKTIGNQIRAVCRKLGFADRRELKGWSGAARGYILTRPPEEQISTDC